MKVAIVADWLTNFAGAEQVVLAMHEVWPEAPIYTSVYDKKGVRELDNVKIITSFLQKIPFAKRKHQLFFPFMPIAFEQFDLSEFNVVISSSHSASKGIITKPGTLHVCYCHTPIRYLWSNYHEYLKESQFNRLLTSFIPRLAKGLRIWDRVAADRVDEFISNSDYIAGRIKKYYRKDATTIYPPVNVTGHKLSEDEGKYFLTVGRLIPYKKIDIVIEAFNRLKLPLKVAGSGPMEKKWKKMAGDNIEFLGRVSDDELRNLYHDARAFIFPAEEDFGIVPVEAMATGRPVIAYNSGGARESVIKDKTGLFFDQQTPESVIGAIKDFEKKKFDYHTIRKHALKFDRPIFKNQIKEFVEKSFDSYQRDINVLYNKVK